MQNPILYCSFFNNIDLESFLRRSGQRSCALRSDPVWTTLLHITPPHLVCPHSPGPCFAWRTGCTQANRCFLPFLFFKQSKTPKYSHCNQTHSSRQNPASNVWDPMDSLVPWGLAVSQRPLGSMRFWTVTMEIWVHGAPRCHNALFGSMKCHNALFGFMRSWSVTQTFDSMSFCISEMVSLIPKCHHGPLVP